MANNRALDGLIQQLRIDYPHLCFTEHELFCWSPASEQVFYTAELANDVTAPFSLLHEVAHALLQHTQYSADYELLRLEVAAWERAKAIGKLYEITIDEAYTQQCIDSYRDWLYKRSICPSCGTKCLQCDVPTHYQCFNCYSRWQVADSRFCRPYRHCANNKNRLPVYVR